MAQSRNGGKLEAPQAAKYHLKIQPLPPPNPFMDTYFDMNVFLMDTTGHMKGGMEIPLKLELLNEDRTVLPPRSANLLTVDPTRPATIAESGMAQLRLKITDVSYLHQNRQFCVRVSCDPAWALPPLVAPIQPVYTTAMTVIRHRLEIVSTSPETWYKDEGGRDKCIELSVQLKGPNGLVTDRPVPLSVSLLYDDLRPVKKQHIMKVSPDTKLRVRGDGTALVRLRVEDVSKNHQGQGFRVMVSPNTGENPLNFDVSAAVSGATVVRSKRNKRMRQKAAGYARNSRARTASARAMPPPPALGPGGAGGVSTAGAAVAAGALKGGAAVFSPNTLATLPATDPHMNPETALNGVVQWSGLVVKALRQLEWQVIGYEMRKDGQLDSSRPILRCPACWAYRDALMSSTQHYGSCSIHAMLHSYQTSTIECLRLLLTRMDPRKRPPPQQQQHQQQQQQQQGVVPLHPPGGNSVAAMATAAAAVAGNNSGGMPSAAAAAAASGSGGGGVGASPATAAVAPPPPLTSGLARPTLGRSDSMMYLTNLLRSASSTALDDLGDALDGAPAPSPMGQWGAAGAAGGAGAAAGLGMGMGMGMGMGGMIWDEEAEAIAQLEQAVYFVIGKQFCTSEFVVGYPAFDQASALVGFYQESTSQGGGTQAEFCPVATLTRLTDADRTTVATMLKEARANNSPALKSLPACGSLQKLKEDAILHSWQKQFVSPDAAGGGLGEQAAAAAAVGTQSLTSL